MRSKSRDGGDTQPPWPLHTTHAGPRRGWVGAHSRARSRETVSGSGPGKQGGALCPPAPGRAEARDRGGRAAVARARARPRPSRLLCFCFDGARVQLARVESRAAAARGAGRRRPGRRGGSQTLSSLSENYREVRSRGAGRSCSPGAVFGIVVTASLPLGCPLHPSSSRPETLQRDRGIERTSQVCYIPGHRSTHIWLFIQAVRCNQPESFRVNPDTHSHS